MVWKYHIANKNESNKLYFKSRVIHKILIFLLKNDLILLYYIFNKKKYNLDKKLNNFNELKYYAKKRVRSFMRKILYTQLKITKYNNWFILNIVLYTTFKKKNLLDKRAQETYFRFRHLYYYLVPSINDFK